MTTEILSLDCLRSPCHMFILNLKPLSLLECPRYSPSVIHKSRLHLLGLMPEDQRLLLPQQMQTSRVYPTRGAQPVSEGQLVKIPLSYSLEVPPRYPSQLQVLPSHHQLYTSDLSRHSHTYAEVARAPTPLPSQPALRVPRVHCTRRGRRPAQSGRTPSSPQKRRLPLTQLRNYVGGYHSSTSSTEGDTSRNLYFASK